MRGSYVPIEKAVLVELYTDQGMSLSEIADELGTTLRTVHRRLIEHGIPRRRSGPRASHGTFPLTWYGRASGVLTRDLLTKNYTRKGKTVAQIAEETGFHPSTVRDSLHRLGFELRGRDAFWYHIDPKQLTKLRHDGRTIAEIAAQLGCSHDTVQRAIKRYGIPATRAASSIASIPSNWPSCVGRVSRLPRSPSASGTQSEISSVHSSTSG